MGRVSVVLRALSYSPVMGKSAPVVQGFSAPLSLNVIRSGGITRAQTLSFFRNHTSHDAHALDHEVEKKAGWMLKGIAAVCLTYVGFNVYPLMGDSMVKHSVALLRVHDPYFKRSGASRLTSIATDDDRRMMIVSAGAVAGLVNMLESATDDTTRREAVKALNTITQIDAAFVELDSLGVRPLLANLAVSSLDLESQQYATALLERFGDWKARNAET